MITLLPGAEKQQRKPTKLQNQHPPRQPVIVVHALLGLGS